MMFVSVASGIAADIVSGPWTYQPLASNTAAIVGYSGPGGNIIFPSSLDGRAVTQIGFASAYSDGLFIFGRSNYSVRNILIPNGVTNIGNLSFRECFALTNVSIPGSVTQIGQEAFASCTNLATVTIPGSATNFGVGIFRFSGLRSVVIGNGATRIGVSAFERTLLTNVILPATVTNIGHVAFYECAALTNVFIPEGVVDIGVSAFYGTSLTNVALPSSLRTIWPSTFQNCSKLTNLSVPASNADYASQDGILFNKNLNIIIRYPGGRRGPYSIASDVTSIDGAFSGCIDLTSISIPDSITTITAGAFAKCASLTNVTFGSNVTNIGDYAFDGCTSLGSVTIPDTVTSIGSYAFVGCYSLTNLSLGARLNDIGNYAFYYCTDLKSATIPESVKSLGDYAFSGCGQLASLLFTGEPPSLGYKTFDNSPITVYYVSGDWPVDFGGHKTRLFQPVSVGCSFAPSSGFFFSWAGTGWVPMSIRRATSPGGPWTVVSSNNATGRFTDTNPPSGKAFYQAFVP